MAFINEDFLLETEEARRLYYDYAANLPIIDYHNHLPPAEIAQDRNFDNITQIWLAGDHYKWRAMRAWGIQEDYITGSASDEEKFMKWAEVVPHTLRNPLFHWTHLELKRYFDLDIILNPNTAKEIYEETQRQLQSGAKSVHSLLRDCKVRMLGTTDDPLDDLSFHQQIARSGFSVKVLPTFRPDKAMDPVDLNQLNGYLDRLEEVTGLSIQSLDDFLQAMQARHDFFHQQGARISDHGLTHILSVPYSHQEVSAIFRKIRTQHPLSKEEMDQYRSACLYEFTKMNHAKGWVQQFHLGAIRNNNSRLLKKLGPDTGFDSIGDFSQAASLSNLLDRLDSTDQLARTIVYNVNPTYNEVFATMMGNFNDGSIRGKMQFGSAWWFLDQLDGMEKQMNVLSNMGLLSTFIGMLTDSRSFLSFPRHEYFRRLLCNLLGNDMKKGLIPTDWDLTGQLVSGICFDNANQYFGFNLLSNE